MRASSSVLAGPFAQAFRIYPIQPVTACGACGTDLSDNLIAISEGGTARRVSARNDLTKWSWQLARKILLSPCSEKSDSILLRSFQFVKTMKSCDRRNMAIWNA